MAISVTTATKNLFLANTPQTITITATPLTGSAITLTQADIVQGSFSIDRSSVSGSNIEIGNASSAELTMTLNSVTNFAYEGATLTVSVAVDNNPVQLGVFVVDEVKRYKTTTNIVALDKMVAFDKEADKTLFGTNANPESVLGVCCTECGVTLGNVSGMVNRSIQINISKIQDVCTYRDIIIWVAECTATNAFINENGELVLKWYTNASQTINEAVRASSDLQNYPITVTGVKVVDGDTEYISGQEGYVVQIVNNPIMVEWSSSIATRLATIANRLVGFSYQAWSAEVLPMPWLLPLDLISFVKDGTTYTSPVTNTLFSLNANTRLAGKGESPMAKGYAQKALTNAQQNVVKGVERKSELADQQLQTQITVINNHFWYDTAGVHVSTIAGDASHGNNVLLDSDSLDIRVGETVRASFGATTQIGEDDNTHIEMTPFKLSTSGKNDTFWAVEDLSASTVVEGFTADGFTDVFLVSGNIETVLSVTVDGSSAPYTYSGRGVQTDDTPPKGSAVVIRYTTTDTLPAFTFGSRDESGFYGVRSATFGEELVASGKNSLAEGQYSTASGKGSHAEGFISIAKGDASHAEGSETWAFGFGSHSEGGGTQAQGEYSHSEGYDTKAIGRCSHAQNEGTKAIGDNQTAIGRYNKEGNEFAFIIGNGIGDETAMRSNAFTVKWNGDVTAIGDITDGLGNKLSNAVEWNTYTANNVFGLTVTVKQNKLIPTLLKVKVYGVLAEEIPTASSYLTLAKFSDLVVSSSTLGYLQFNAVNAGQVRVLTDGSVQIGYTRNYATNTNVNLASGAGVYIDTVVITA